MCHIFYSTYADASMYQGSTCRGSFASSANMSTQMFFGQNETLVKQADGSLLFPLLMKALERCVTLRVYTIHKFSLLEKCTYMAIYEYHRIDQDIRSRKSSHKDTPISVLFWTFWLGKLINSVDPQ